MMAVPADFDIEDGEASYDDNMTTEHMDVSCDGRAMSENENATGASRSNTVLSASIQNQPISKNIKKDEDEDGVPAPITIAKQSKNLSKKLFTD